MKICFAVCEYNPLHNGHLLHLRTIRERIAPECVAVLMSGNFTQRGEIALLDKYTRAKHAVLAGADIVFELPAVFATAPAEIFATGAVRLLSSVQGEKTLCFGTESGTKESFLSTAAALTEESREFRSLMKQELKTGVSQIRAKVKALQKMKVQDLDFDLLKSPNNVLGVEYAKAVLSLNSDAEIYPILRKGADYLDRTIHEDLSSASAIRDAIARGEKTTIENNVPPFVYRDLPDRLPDIGDLAVYSALSKSKKDLGKILDCTEGLENRIKAFALHAKSYDDLTEKLKTKRYTCTRLNRILTSSVLNIEKTLVKKCLSEASYLKVLAVKKERSDLLSYFSSHAEFPLILRKNDVEKLEGNAKKSFEKDLFCDSVYNYVAKTEIRPFDVLFV